MKVIYGKRDRIGYVTLNRPETLNALDDELNDALWEVWADLTLTGRDVSAGEAYRLGLVNQVVPHEELLPTAERWARMILANGQQAIRSAKETILEVIGRPLDDALRLETVKGIRASVISARSRRGCRSSSRNDFIPGTTSCIAWTRTTEQLPSNLRPTIFVRSMAPPQRSRCKGPGTTKSWSD